MKKFLHSDWLQYSFHVTPMQKRANTVQNIVNSVKNDNELFNGLKRKACRKFFPLTRHVDLTDRTMTLARFGSMIFVRVLPLLCLCYQVTVFGKIRSYINESEVIFFEGNLEWVSTRNFQKFVLLSWFKKRKENQDIDTKCHSN